MSWWFSKAGESLLAEVNTRWPGRSKASDGTLGDAAHRAEGSGSDHNPRADGEVCALDITTTGILSSWLAEHLRQRSLGGDHRIKYVIFNRRIFDISVNAFWRPYDGVDPHTSHVHVSFNPHSGAAPSWGVATATPATPSAPAWPGIPLRYGVSAGAVRTWQTQMHKRGWNIQVDGSYGQQSQSICRQFQQQKKLAVTGIVDQRTWEATWTSPVT